MRNKKIISLGLVAVMAVSLLASSLVFAEETTTNTATTEESTTTSETKMTPEQRAKIQAENKAKRDAALQNRQDNLDKREASTEDRKANSEKMAEERTKMREQRVATMKKLMQAQLVRAQNAIDRLGQIIERIKSRREKLAAEGANLSEVDAMIAKAVSQKNVAQAALDKAKANYAALGTGDDPGASVRTFMASMKDLKMKLIELHRTLIGIVKELREAGATVKKTTDRVIEENSETNN